MTGPEEAKAAAEVDAVASAAEATAAEVREAKVVREVASTRSRTRMGWWRWVVVVAVVVVVFVGIFVVARTLFEVPENCERTNRLREDVRAFFHDDEVAPFIPEPLPAKAEEYFTPEEDCGP